MVTLTQLEYIVAVDTYRHFGKAAEHCFITQPTLSMQIKKLEEDLEIIIFDRSKQPLIPTDVGARIIEQARIVLKQSEEINNIVKDHKNQVSGMLRVGIIPTLAPYLLPVFIGNYKKKYPNIFIKVVEQTTENIVELLNKDLIDVGILVTPLKEEKIIVFFESDNKNAINKLNQTLGKKYPEVEKNVVLLWMGTPGDRPGPGRLPLPSAYPQSGHAGAFPDAAFRRLPGECHELAGSPGPDSLPG